MIITLTLTIGAAGGAAAAGHAVNRRRKKKGKPTLGHVARRHGARAAKAGGRAAWRAAKWSARRGAGAYVQWQQNRAGTVARGAGGSGRVKAHTREGRPVKSHTRRQP